MQSEFQVLNSHLHRLGLDLPVMIENYDSSPPTDGKYLATWFVPAGESAMTVNGSNESGGYYQIDVIRPVGEGPAPLIELLDMLKAHFRPSALKNEHGRLTISKITVHKLPGDQRAGRIMRIFWRSFS